MGAANGGPGPLQLDVVGQGTGQLQVVVLVLGHRDSCREPSPAANKPRRSPHPRESRSLPRREPCSSEPPQSRPKPGHMRPISFMPVGALAHSPSEHRARREMMSQSWWGSCTPAAKEGLCGQRVLTPRQSTSAVRVIHSLIVSAARLPGGDVVHPPQDRATISEGETQTVETVLQAQKGTPMKCKTRRAGSGQHEC